MSDLTAQLCAPIAPYRALTVTELTSRHHSDGHTALMRVLRPAAASVSVEQLLRREGRSAASPHTRHVAEPPPQWKPPPARGTTIIVAPPPQHSTMRPAPTTRAMGPRPHGLGPLAAMTRQPFTTWTA